jgi:uncharacterized protein (DUF488 family)
MTAPSRGVVGVGYEGRQAEQFVRDLAAAGVGVVVDVRLTPSSRKPGFSKRSLAERLSAAGIGYEHLPALGNPKNNRPGFAGEAAELRAARARYAALLSTSDAEDALARVRTLASTGIVALLCFEADEHRCHRQVILTHLDRGRQPPG